MSEQQKPLIKAKIKRRYANFGFIWWLECGCSFSMAFDMHRWNEAMWIGNQHVYIEHRIL